MDNNLEKLRKSAHLTQHKLENNWDCPNRLSAALSGDISTITLEHLSFWQIFYQVSIDYLLDRTKAKEVGKNSRLSVRFWKNTMNWFGRWRCLMNVILVSYP